MPGAEAWDFDSENCIRHKGFPGADRGFPRLVSELALVSDSCLTVPTVSASILSVPPTAAVKYLNRHGRSCNLRSKGSQPVAELR
jgi:hypothetical protein